MNNKRNIKLALIALMLALSIALMSACSLFDDSGNNTKSDKVTATQFDKYIQDTLDYFDDFSKPLQLVIDIKTSGLSEIEKQEFSRAANGIEMAKTTYGKDIGLSYRKHEDGRIKEYSLSQSDNEWFFDEYEEDYFSAFENQGFGVILPPAIGNFNWFEYKDNAYCIKASHLSDMFGIFESVSSAVFKEFKLSFKNSKISAVFIKATVGSTTETASYTITYKNTPITIPQAALDKDGQIPGKMTKSDFYYSIMRTVDKINYLYEPFELNLNTRHNNKVTDIGAKRSSDGKEHLYINELSSWSEIYCWNDGYSYASAETGTNYAEWDIKTISYAEYENKGGLVGDYLKNEIPLTVYLETLADCYDWFQYERNYESYNVKPEFLNDVYNLLLSKGENLVPEDGKLTDFVIYFEDGKIKDLYIDIEGYDFYFLVSCYFNYKSVYITIPDSVIKETTFSSNMNRTVSYINNLNNPFSAYAIDNADFDAELLEAKRSSDGKEWVCATDSYETYAWCEGNIRIIGTKNYDSGNWVIEKTSYSEYEQSGGLLKQNDLLFFCFLELFADRSGWFDYDKKTDSYFLTPNYLGPANDLLLSNELFSVGIFSLDGLRYCFYNGKVSGLSFDLLAYGNIPVSLSFFFEYEDVNITIPNEALYAAYLGT